MPRRNPQDTTRTRQSPDDETSRTELDLTTQRGSTATNQRSRDPTPRPNCNARRRPSDLDVLIDGHSVTALVDTGADYSVINGPFATKLKKVWTAWEGPEIRTAGGHLVTPEGMCTARLTIDNRIYPANFVVLQRCSRDVILGMDVLGLHGAVIDLRSKSITISTEKALPPHTPPGKHALNVLDEQVTIPPRSSIIISVGTQKSADLKGVVEGDQHQLINREICVARGITELRKGTATVMLTNFGNEYKHANKGTTVTYIEEIVEATTPFALTDSSEPTPKNQALQPAFDVDPSLPKHKQKQLKTLLLQYKD